MIPIKKCPTIRAYQSADEILIDLNTAKAFARQALQARPLCLSIYYRCVKAKHGKCKYFEVVFVNHAFSFGHQSVHLRYGKVA